MTYCPSPTSISTWASAPAVAPTMRANPIPKTIATRQAHRVIVNDLGTRSRRGMAVLLFALLLVRHFTLVGMTLSSLCTRCRDGRQTVPKNQQHVDLVPLGSKQRNTDVSGHSRFGQTGDERVPIQCTADITAGDRVHRLVALVDHHRVLAR